MSSKYYTVWAGRQTGVFDSWEECQRQVHKFEGAKFKSFKTREEAEAAFAHVPVFKHGKSSAGPAGTAKTSRIPVSSACIRDSLAVDAACSGNPGQMEYRGVYVQDGREIFHSKVYQRGTNNIGEFLAIVHGLALLKKQGLAIPLYSDSRTALAWVKAKKCRTKIPFDELDEDLRSRISAAEKWLEENSYPNQIFKWETSVWGEIPADFGRK